MKIFNVVGARPNFMKIAPLLEEMKRHPSLEPVLVHTGQHYDEKMSRLFFEDLQLPKPDVDLEVGSGSHAAQTAEVMLRFEPLCLRHKPDAILVVGDVNSTIACALVAAKLGILVVHVEAGLRSYDRSMPEEINRILTDALSDLLFTTEAGASDNLMKEGIPAAKIHFVGNVMIDTLLRSREKAKSAKILDDLHLSQGHYAVVTLHRPSNVDDKAQLHSLLRTFSRIAEQIPVVFPMHPRTVKQIDLFGLNEIAKSLRITAPLGYLDMLHLMSHAKMVLTDSGGIQEETTVLGVPCLTLRLSTERPVTITQGTNLLVGVRGEDILREAALILDGKGKAGRIPPKWDGKAAERIVEVLRSTPLNGTPG